MWREAVTGAGKCWPASGGQAKESADSAEGANVDGSSVVRANRRGSRPARTAPSRVAFVLLGFWSAVWAYSLIQVLTRAFYAKGDAGRPVRVAVAMVGLNPALNVTQ